MHDALSDQDLPQVTIFADETAKKNLEKQMDVVGLGDFCRFEIHKEKVIIIRFGAQEVLFPLPVRLGRVIDQILMFREKARGRRKAKMDLGLGILDIVQGTFKSLLAEGEPVVLTEKEVEVLRYLHMNADRKVPRDELLNAVWGYAKTTETHTLETHIYRLRRKIEPDPASPVILRKDEDGYYLGLPD